MSRQSAASTDKTVRAVLPDREQQQKLRTRFFAAIRDLDTRQLARCLKRWPQLATKTEHKEPSLVVVVQQITHEKGRSKTKELMEMMALLLPLANVNAGDRNGKTALMFAACYGQPDLVRVLLPHSDIHAKDNEGSTALMYTTGDKAQNKDCFLLLLSAHQEQKRPGAAGEALREVASRGCAGNLRLVLPWAIQAREVDDTDEQEKTAFDLALEDESTECVDLLGAAGSASRASGLLEYVPKKMHLPQTRALIERAALDAELGLPSQAEPACAKPAGTPNARRNRL